MRWNTRSGHTSYFLNNIRNDCKLKYYAHNKKYNSYYIKSRKTEIYTWQFLHPKCKFYN